MDQKSQPLIRKSPGMDLRGFELFFSGIRVTCAGGGRANGTKRWGWTLRLKPSGHMGGVEEDLQKECNERRWNRLSGFGKKSPICIEIYSGTKKLLKKKNSNSFEKSQRFNLAPLAKPPCPGNHVVSEDCSCQLNVGDFGIKPIPTYCGYFFSLSPGHSRIVRF
ncbi:hypothetical protein CEXT_738741 [Caerostris extrusa]|uniref:Uncharacterized protein n=1 Tax=Caerostris extrusa TaxID=172846 RepID=A0AAV4PN62_CAEEX|nr:hypothetical protein CEXT_738741 [Caerostris extrusa]